VEILRQELEETRNAATARESELLNETESLRAMINELLHVSSVDRERVGSDIAIMQNRTAQPAISEEKVEPHLIDMFDGEMSMELATPLPPSSILPPSPPAPAEDASPYVDPPSIPLPTSPELYDMIRRLASPGGESHPPLESTLERLERELATANCQIEEGENEYGHLQCVVEDLRQPLDHS
jgi:hypothetical protein